MPRSRLSALLLAGLPLSLAALLAAPGCGNKESPPSGNKGSPPSGAPTVRPIGPPDDAPTCASDADCKGGTVCFYNAAGCDAAAITGRCHEPSWSHECVANTALCGCDGRTLWGNNCSDVIRERWTRLGACACKSDADCHGGQVCFFRGKGCDTAGECEDPARRRCSEHTQSICTCKGKTLSATCVGEMREPWTQVGPCAPPR
jgi:hypothetical protein